MKIICVHQSADLYGSDRSFLQVVEHLKQSGKFDELLVVLPRNGPLADKLQSLGVEIQFLNLSLLSKTYLKTLQWGKILFPLLSSKKKLALFNRFDIVYVNTSVILDFYLLAPFIKSRKIIHIREIPAKWLGRFLSWFIKRADCLVIFNSFSTKRSFDNFSESMVIHNAFEGYPVSDPGYADEKVPNRPLRLLLIGRLNGWKGQAFTINALSSIKERAFTLRIVGSPSAGNENLLDDLKAQVAGFGLMEKIEFVPFTENPATEYMNADVVLVPSLKPEPFGRTAIEAMSLGKPVIAARHGGLPEIIQHNVNGYLFEPGDIASFNKYLGRYFEDRTLVGKHGESSKRIFEENFSIDRMNTQLDDVFAIN